MKALAVSGVRDSLTCDFPPEKVLVEKPHPSEDGEALRKNGHASVSSASSTTPDGMAAALHAPNLFALYTTSRHEKHVARHLSQRQIEFYLPLYQSKRKWRDGSKVPLALPLFPGYISVHIRRSERVRK